MLSKRSPLTPVLATLFSLSPEISIAAEDSLTSAFPVWPFFAIVIVAFIFLRRCKCSPSLKPKKPPLKSPTKQENVAPAPKSPEVAPKIPEAAPEVKDEIIDLTDNSQQCQASTAKGTRCKRKTTLEETSITLNNKTYLITVCRQHNNDHLTPFSELIK